MATGSNVADSNVADSNVTPSLVRSSLDANCIVLKPSVNPIDLSACKFFPDTRRLQAYIATLNAGHREHRDGYGRYGNDTRRAVESELLRMEVRTLPHKGRDAYLVSDGMRAVTALLNGLLFFGSEQQRHSVQNPAHIIAGSNCYRKIRDHMTGTLAACGVQTTFLNPEEYLNLAAYIRPNTRLVFLETPSNPFLRCSDIRRAAETATGARIPLIVDSTFGSPINQSPLELGANLVIHSCTKYLSGHNNVMAGVVIGDSQLVATVRNSVAEQGGVLDPAAAARLSDGLKTLALRVEAQNARALALAEYLEQQPPELVRRVWYPMLRSHPDFEVAANQMRGGGAVISLELNSSSAETYGFLDALKVAKISESFGGVLTLAQPVALISYSQYTPEQRKTIGIGDGLIRLSIGIDYTGAELIAGFAAALKHIEKLRN